MNQERKKFLNDLAKSGDLRIEFPDGAPIRISGFRHGNGPMMLVNPDQPDSELIFDILQKIGLVATHIDSQPINFPRFLDRPYENERAGEISYKARRVVRQKFNANRRAELWALCAYSQLPFPLDFYFFAYRHPERVPDIFLVWGGSVKAKLTALFTSPLKFLSASLR